MLRISALNDSLSSDDSQASHFVKEATKEAKEAEAYSLYNKALELLRHGHTEKAEAVFRDLIDHDFLQEAADLLEEKGGDAIHPGLQLLYSMYKNLAAMATKRQDYSSAVDSYIEAVKIDNSEVTVWYKLGITSLKIEDFLLAKKAFEEGLECNPKHWPCLDNIITVMFALNNYSECLYFISKAFEMEIYYDKGHAIRNKIYRDQPCLKSDTEEFFMYCDKELSDVKIDPSEAKQYVDEALQMRKRRQELSKPPEPIKLKFPKQLKEYSWQCVGETLIGLYDKAVNSEPIISLCLTVDVPNYDGVPSEKDLKLTEKETSQQISSETADKTGDIATGTNKKDGDSVILIDEKEESTPMDVDEDADQEKTEKREVDDCKPMIEDEVDNKDPGVKADLPDEEKKPDSTHFENEEKMEISDDALDKSKEISESEDIAVIPDESSGSLLEAVNVAHSLLDSLSPAKVAPQDDKSIVKTENDPADSAKGVTSLAEKMDSAAESNKTEMEKTFGDVKIAAVLKDAQDETSQSRLVKSSSFGFSVSNVAVDPLNTPIDKSESAATSVKSTADDSNIPKVDNDNSVSVTSKLSNSPSSNEKTTETSPSTQIKPSVPISAPVIDLTEMDSDSEPETKNLTGPPSLSRVPVSSQGSLTSLPVVTSLPASQSLLTSSPLPNRKPVDATPDLLSPVHSTKPIVPSSPNVDSEVTKTTQESGSSAPQGIQNKDHAYSKASSNHDSVPIVTSPQCQSKLLVAESIPVTQQLLGTMETGSVDSSPGIGFDIDDKNAASRRLQKKRKLSIETEELMMFGKRRSTRVKKTDKKKEEEPVKKFKDLLQAFLPSSLKRVQEEDSSVMDSSKDESVTAEKSIQGENSGEKGHVMPLYEVLAETDDVKSFLNEQNIKNSGLMDVMNKFLHAVAKNWKLKWSGDLCKVYIDVFDRIRKFVYMPNVLDTFDGAEIFQKMALICLVLSELQLDLWLTERSEVTGLQSVSPIIKSTQVLLEENIPAYYEEDLWFLTILCGHSDRLEDLWIDHCVRVYWMKSKYAILLGKIEEAIYCYERLKEYLEHMKEEHGAHEVVIPNCKMENIITLELVTSQQDMLQKVHCVEETQRLFEQGEFERVVEILLQTFSQPQQKSKVMKVESSERRSQLTLLQDAMYKTENNKRSVLWGEESLNEAYLEYKMAGDPEDKAAWLTTVIDILSCLQRVLDRDSSVVGSLPSVNLVRLSQNLIRLIDKNMSLPETATEMIIDTVIPWTLLYQLIKFEEDKLESMRLKDSNSSDDLDDAISSSQMLLNVAHDYLGGRSWCTKSDGSLLLFYMNVLNDKLDVESNNQEEYQQAFEQCVYCLFGHPNKKAKAKHLQDHNVTGISLQWEHAVLVFDYYKPKAIPEFDGYKSETISTELEVLFKRIIPLVPEDCKSKVLALEEVQSYIDGTKDTSPALKEDMTIENPVLEEVYYLLADYYLKNSEFMKAIKFYTLDLCVNPDRLDSWAGMALARMSQLESKLTSAEIKMDAPIYKKSIAALRCFKRATEIDDSNAKLWIEYGTLAYQLHAHASKQIRWKKWFAMEQDVVEIAVASKQAMLQTAFDCFKRASDWNEEEWLHNYMMGKCLEKMGKPVKDVLQYYIQAFVNVHEDKAKYPKKIVYAYTTPHLSVEALELYYRIHVIILKCLMQHATACDDIDYKLFATAVTEAAYSPFALRVEKGQEAKLDQESASSADESSCSEINTPMKKSTQGSADHTYFRQKSNPDSNTATVTNEDKQKPSTEKGGDDPKASVVVTTMELHAEPSSDDQVTLTTTTTECPNNTRDKKLESNATVKAPSVAIVDQEKGVSDSVEGANGVNNSVPITKEADKDKDTVEEIVKSILNHIEDLVASKVDKSTESHAEIMEIDDDKTKPDDKIQSDEKVKSDDKRKPEDEGKVDGNTKADLKGLSDEMNVLQDGRSVNADDDIFEGLKLLNLSSKKEEMLESLLKLSQDDLHLQLLDRCRKAFELCLFRFPTHYKSHYRLAQIYSKITHLKDLDKAHNLMLAGSVKWQQLSYIPCQAMFGERKMSKFFQGIWKIPIDEIDRAGSFPSHLNRCIELMLNILKEQSDCHALHQVHLQLNRQPEPGKKYLRDAEKKYYALMSHRYTLDAAEARIQEMKTITDTEQRHKFLLLFYKIWEHGVHKLNKQAERTNKLLAEAYRVVLRKLETLPHKMLLDQAVRYCKHLMSQKSKVDKDTKPSGGDTTPDGRSKSGIKLSAAEETVKSIKLISLENIMKSQENLKKLTKAVVASKKAELNGQNGNANKKPTGQDKQTDEQSEKTGQAIVIDSSSDSSSDSEENSNMETKPPDVKPPGPVSTTPSIPGSAGSATKAPTVKIKMGLLQAAKRLKPNPSAGDGTQGERDEEKMEEDLDASLDDEVPDLLDDGTNGSDDGSSSSSDGSSSSGESSSDDDDDNEEKNDGDDDADDDKSDDDSSDDDNDDDRDAKVDAAKVDNQSEGSFEAPDIQVVISSSSDNEDEESSDDSQEVDLVSSGDEGEKDDEKDTDYKASEDEDIIMISDDEFKSKSRAIVPSPPHSEVPKREEKTEILVQKVPDFNFFSEDI